MKKIIKFFEHLFGIDDRRNWEEKMSEPIVLVPVPEERLKELKEQGKI